MSEDTRKTGDEQPGDRPAAGTAPVADGGAVSLGQRMGLPSLGVSRDFVQSLPFWLPPTLLLLFFVYGAIVWNFVFSLTDFEGLRYPAYDVSNFDFEMYGRLLGDPAFWLVTKNTLFVIVLFTGLCLVVGLGLAILLDRQLRFKDKFQTVYLLPFSLSFVVTGLLWTWMYNPKQGMINLTMDFVGLEFLTQNWLGDPRLTLASVVFALVWQYSGYAMVVFLASIQSIPTEHYEAARVDGASTFKVYWRVVIPQLSPAAVSVAVVLMVFALKAFDFLFVVFGFNPGTSADILATFMYRQAFQANRWAYGAAIATVMFLLTLAVLAPYLYKQYQSGDL
jgi:glucose/mannose transport system permease protein